MFDIVNSALSTTGINMAIKIIFWLLIFVIALMYGFDNKRGKR